MNLRPLFITPQTRAEADAICAYAAANPYYPGDAVVPGNIPQHILTWETGYRAVFSLTASAGRLWRHLTLSVPSDQYPSPEAVKAIALLFGFTPEPIGKSGFPVSWGLEINKTEHCIVVVEKTEQLS